jgi:F0F1-type ATP synthase assembly protein I
MFRLDVLQSQWLILALVGGTALVLVFFLAYAAAWRARDAREAAGPDAPAALRAARRVPWVVITFILAIVAYAVVYVMLAVLNPPNV